MYTHTYTYIYTHICIKLILNNTDYYTKVPIVRNKEEARTLRYHEIS